MPEKTSALVTIFAVATTLGAKAKGKNGEKSQN
jgi:hypothetical protein